MDPKTTSLELPRLRQLVHCIRRWSSGRLFQHINVDGFQKFELLFALEDTVDQVRRDYHQSTESFLWEFIADFHRHTEQGDPGNLSKWLYNDVFVPRTPPLSQSESFYGHDTTEYTTMIPPTLSPPQTITSNSPGHPVVTIIQENHPQSCIHPPALHPLDTCFPNNVLSGKLSANAKARLRYKSSPYYQCVMALTQPGYGHKAKKERSLVLNLLISTSLAQMLEGNTHYMIMLFCASNETPNNQRMAMEFPDNCHILVNNQRLDWSPQGMKNKPGTFSPADITRLCQLQESANNRVELRYSNASKVFHASLHLVNPIDAKTAVSALIRDKFITKEYTYQSLKEKAKDDDIMELSSTLSLKCPLSVQRIEVPCRSSKCTHLQCFDAYTFLSINQRVHRWVCPVCNRAMDSWEEIIVDGYYLDILESTPKNLDNVNISPDGKWVVLAPRTSLDMTSSIPMLSDSKSSSSGTKLNRADKEPIYVIDDDDEEESTSGSRDSRDNEMTGAGRMDSSMEVEEVEVYNPGSKEIGARTRRQEGSMQPSNNSQQLTVTTIPPAKAPSRSESSLLPHSNSQPVPREHHFMDLTLYPSTDVIDLTTDSEDEDRDRTLVYGMTRRVSVQPSNGVRNSSISTENVNKNGTSRKYVASTAILNNHTNNNSNRISIESLLGTSSCVKLSEVTMDDTFESGRVLPGYALSSNSQQQLANYSSTLTSNYHPTFSPTLSPPTPGPTLLGSYPACVRFSPSSDGDVVSLQFDPPLYMANTWDGTTPNGIYVDPMSNGAGVDMNNGVFDSGSWPVVSESAIPVWSTFNAAYASPFMSQSRGVFRERSQGEEVGGLQAGLLTIDSEGGGVRLEADGQQEGREEEVGERPNKRPHTSKSYSPNYPILDSVDPVQAAIEQCLSSQNFAI